MAKKLGQGDQSAKVRYLTRPLWPFKLGSSRRAVQCPTASVDYVQPHWHGRPFVSNGPFPPGNTQNYSAFPQKSDY